MRALRLALRALRWRRGQSAVLLLVATAATTCAALGPVWARAAEESLLQERLRAAPVSETSFEQQVGRSYDITPGRLLDGLEEASRDRQVGRWFGPAELGVRVPTVVVRDRGREVAVAGVGWYPNACRSVRLVQGR